MRLCGGDDAFKGVLGLCPPPVVLQGLSQDQELVAGLETTEGLLHFEQCGFPVLRSSERVSQRGDGAEQDEGSGGKQDPRGDAWQVHGCLDPDVYDPSDTRRLVTTKTGRRAPIRAGNAHRGQQNI